MESPLSKLEKFDDWARQNGIISPKVKHAAVFEKGITGVKALAAIESREAFLYIPYKCLITMSMVDKIPELKEIVDKYEMFQVSSGEYKANILPLILCWEYQKGEQSFWWPYIEVLPSFEILPWDLDCLEGA